MLNPTILGGRKILLKSVIDNYRRTICTSKVEHCFHEVRGSGYPRKYDLRETEEPTTFRGKFEAGLQMCKEEFSLLRKEIVDLFRGKRRCFLRPGEVDIEWRFEGDPKILDQFVITVDSDYDEGNSKASIELTKTGRGIFSGFVDTTVKVDGKQKRAGFCNVRTVRKRKSFYRDADLNWEIYTHLVMRIRGDGRNYLLVIGAPGEYDLLWNDTYQYILYTRGGPYWQEVRIPFSKFLLVSKGRIQDIQQPPPLHKLKTLSITAAKVHGSFKLEIDYIGVENDFGHTEEHAYEMYRPPHQFIC